MEAVMERKQVQFFNFEGNDVRTVVIDNEPFFVGKDIAEVMGYSKARNAISTHVEDEDKKDAPIQGVLGGTQNMTVINESGMYSLILSSKLQSAKRFKRWVTNEVLPTIRKNGVYMTNEKAYDITHNSDGLADLLLQAGRQLQEKNVIIEEMKPKALFADSVATSDTSILVSELAKLLKQNGVDIGQNRLFTWLRKNGYLISRRGTDWNMPTQKSMNLELFQVTERPFNNPDGSVRITKTTKVTGKGQQYFIKKFLS